MIERDPLDQIGAEIAERFLIAAPADSASLAWVVQSKRVDDRIRPAEAEHSRRATRASRIASAWR